MATSLHMHKSFTICNWVIQLMCSMRVKGSYLVTRVSFAAWWSDSPQLALEREHSKEKDREAVGVRKEKTAFPVNRKVTVTHWL